MTNYRYTQILVPMDRYVRRLTPKSRRLLALLEGSLLLVLSASVLLYVQ